MRRISKTTDAKGRTAVACIGVYRWLANIRPYMETGYLAHHVTMKASSAGGLPNLVFRLQRKYDFLAADMGPHVPVSCR